jgi:hypothetical protein
MSMSGSILKTHVSSERGEAQMARDERYNKKPLDPDIDPWERQPGEGSKPFNAFTIYRDLGSSRSVRKVGIKIGNTKVMTGRWCAKWSWVERVRAYETHLDQIAVAATEQAIKDMRGRHVELATGLQQFGASALQKLIEENQVDKLPITEVRQFIIEGAKLEATSRGAPEKIEEVRSVKGYAEIARMALDDDDGDRDDEWPEV